MNILAQLELELAYYEVVDQYIDHEESPHYQMIL